MVDSTPWLPGLSPLCGKRIDARFDGGRLSSDAGLLLLREVEDRLGLSRTLAQCIPDRRNRTRCDHTLDEIIRFRMMAIAAGYEDGNDCDRLRVDPVFKMAVDRQPIEGADLCSQSTVSRLENRPSRTMLLRMAGALIDRYCASFSAVPDQITLDIDDTFDAVHGCQQLRLFNAHDNEYGVQPIVVFDASGRPVTAVLRPAKRPSGREIVTVLKRLIGRIRENWPRVTILLRGDSHYGCGEVLDWCESQKGVRYIFGVAGTSALHKEVETLKASTEKRYAATAEATTGEKKLRRFKEIYGGPKSWAVARRIIARVEASDQGVDVRYIVTNFKTGRPKAVYERTYCRRGQMENFIKGYKTHLAADRTSCCKPTANQFRLFLHLAAYWLMWAFRQAAPKRSSWHRSQFDTLRLHLIKVAVRVEELKTVIRLHLPAACPVAQTLQMFASRILPSLRLAT